ncbi:MAG: hypothetical protein AB7D42_02165 [Candidatus Methanomethylophilaceae archaeon]|nr:hypothetical protein [Candidatus Methanomethylophilaceae archaeon]
MTGDTTLKQDLRHGVWWKGMLSAVLSFISIVVVPLVIIWFIKDLVATMGAGDEMTGVLDTVTETVWRYMIYGIPVIVLAFFTAFYTKGNKAKLLFKIITLGYSIAWLFLIFQGGVLPLSIDTSGMFSDGDFSLESIDLALDILGIMLIIVVLILLRMVLAYAVYRSNREKYLEKLSE